MSNSTFGSFEIGRRALHAQQKGVQVTGQNIANANTEGYSRQAVQMRALVPPAVPGVSTAPGYGVEVSDITRLKSEFYGEQIMKALSDQHYWERLGQTVDGIEAIFQEPDENGINIYLNEFFDAWQEVSVNPESYAARISLREQAVSLTGLVRDIYERLDEFKYDVEKELDTVVSQINSLATEIAGLNEKITYLQALGQKSNEMLDERDLRLQELSELVDIRVIQRTNGSVEVLAGGRLLLHDNRSFELEKEIKGDVASVKNNLGAELSVKGGALRGMLESYNEVFPRYMDGLDDFVSALVEEVNKIHNEGFGLDGVKFGDGEDGKEGENYFFEPILEPGDSEQPVSAAKTFAVAQRIIDDPGRIAAASSIIEESEGEETPLPGDGGNALKIAQLREDLVSFGNEENKATFHDYYRGMIADLGVEGRETNRMLQNFITVADRLQEQQESVSSVSLDDEMLNMVQFQHAYNAAARFLTVFDEMLAILLSELGR